MGWPTAVVILGLAALLVVAVVGGKAKVSSTGVELNSVGFFEHLRKADEARGRAQPSADQRTATLLALTKAVSNRKLPTAKVLWVDDHVLNNYWERLALASTGIMVDSYATNVDGLSALGLSNYDVVLSDVERDQDVPPTHGGLEFLKEVRRAHPTIPFFFYTGHVTRDSREELRAAGATDAFDAPGPLLDAIAGALPPRG